MKRKVVKHGPSTYIVSLPSRWVKRYGVERGSELEVREEDSALVISTEVHSSRKEIDIDITNLDRSSIMYVIRGLYRQGYDTIRITFSNQFVQYYRAGTSPSVISVLHKVVGLLIGYEIMTEQAGSCVISDLQDVSGKDFDQVLRRIFLLLSTTAQEMLEGARSGDWPLVETIEEKHDTITKFVSYCLRLLNKKSHPNYSKTSTYYHIIATLDGVSDVISYAARDLAHERLPLTPQIHEIIAIVLDDLERYHQLFYKFDNKMISEINANRYRAEEKLKKLTSDLPLSQIIVAARMFHILEHLLDLVEARTALEY